MATKKTPTKSAIKSKKAVAGKAALPKSIPAKTAPVKASGGKRPQEPKWVKDFIKYAQENPAMALVGAVAVLLALLLIFG